MMLAQGKLVQRTSDMSNSQLIAVLKDLRTGFHAAIRSDPRRQYQYIDDLRANQREIRRRGLVGSPEYEGAVLSAFDAT